MHEPRVRNASIGEVQFPETCQPSEMRKSCITYLGISEMELLEFVLPLQMR